MRPYIYGFFYFERKDTMQEKIKKLQKEIEEKIKNVKDMTGLNDLKSYYLNKKGPVSELSNELKDLSIDDKKTFGKAINDFKNNINEKIESLKSKYEEELLNKKLKEETIDVTLPSSKIRRGSKHPNSLTIEAVEDLFVSMGYDVVEGPELETDEYCFEKLNLPKGHPARDMQDSFYITDEYLLRTQTSSVQARYMESKDNEPIRIIVPGKTYRREEDATHAAQFAQIEGLVIDKKENNVSLADLKGTLEVFARKMLGKNLDLRFRPSYFPFTEPSYEVDVTCFKCGGKGCNLCKNTGWIEVFAAGIVHPNVLRANGYDPEVWGGFAFGPGWDRITMFRYGIPDIRYLYQNDIRLLKQFDRKDEE